MEKCQYSDEPCYPLNCLLTATTAEPTSAKMAEEAADTNALLDDNTGNQQEVDNNHRISFIAMHVRDCAFKKVIKLDKFKDENTT